MSKHIAIIGTGFGALGAAARLLAEGYNVTLFEKRDKPGGRAYVFEENGFRFDAGPTVITAPFMFDDIFNKAGKKREDYFELVPCQPFYRIFNHEGRHFDYNSDESFIFSEIDRWNPEDKEGYRKFMQTTRAIFQKGFVELADQPFLSFMDMLRVAPDLIRLKSHENVYKYVSRYVKDEFLRRCFSFHPLLVGGNPFDTTSIYAMIHYLEREWGVHYAMGGTGSIVNGLTKLIEELGGKIHLETEVKRIRINDRRQVEGLELSDGEFVPADAVISNGDVAFTYRNMIDESLRKTYTNRKIDKMKYSMSLFVMYFGTDRRYTDTKLKHHNIILSERYKGLLNDIFNKKELADDFSLYLHMPTYTDPSLAPEGGESFYVLSPVPHLDGDTDWNEMAEPYGDRILEFLEENYLPDLRKHLKARLHIDPLHFRDTLNSHKGSAFSVQPLLTQSAWFRPHNRSEDFPNLYFVGAGTHPGAGLPGVLSSSVIAENLIRNDIPLNGSA
ncbi:phytoene desaturase family protein [Natronogracilivirga saccharolytica]|uniref:Phytoene dehydrogenase n=1 Tax=Natronogracilivirga saccharolytica TaxID=2812953 RepID=A0A8J7RHR2_9BACT|nr:phytoene desaturase family protein [Natronogracilivirga saccharolytica]MBP3192040.1 phytoene desaturase [Natronogracilivirga saccharolytica]